MSKNAPKTEISARNIVNFINDVNSALKEEDSDVAVERTLAQYQIGDDVPYSNLEDIIWLIVDSQRWLCSTIRSKSAQSALKEWLNIIAFLLRNGADPSIHFEEGRSLLGCAMGQAWDDCCELLLQYGADPNSLENGFRTPLCYMINDLDHASWLNFRPMIQIVVNLLNHGADLCMPGFYRKRNLLVNSRAERYYGLSVPLYDILTMTSRYGAPLRHTIFPFLSSSSIESLAQLKMNEEGVPLPESYQRKLSLYDIQPTESPYQEFDYDDSSVVTHYQALKAIYELHPLISRGDLKGARQWMTERLGIQPNSLLPHNRQYFVSLLFANFNRPSTVENPEERKRYLEFIQKLLDEGLDVNRRALDDRTLLSDAVSCREPELCERLLELGADPYAFYDKDYNPWHKKSENFALYDAILFYCVDQTYHFPFPECVSPLLTKGVDLQDERIAKPIRVFLGEYRINVEGCTARTVGKLTTILEEGGVSKEELVKETQRRPT